MCACVGLFAPIYQCMRSFGRRKQRNRPCPCAEIVRNCLLPSSSLCLSLSLSLVHPLSSMFSTATSIPFFYFSISAASHVCPFFLDFDLLFCVCRFHFTIFLALDLCICSLFRLSLSLSLCPRANKAILQDIPGLLIGKGTPHPTFLGLSTGLECFAFGLTNGPQSAAGLMFSPH